MTASLTAGSSWCQTGGELKEEECSVSRGFLRIYLFLFPSEKLEDAGLFNADQIISWKRQRHHDELKQDYFEYMGDFKVEGRCK